jgi:hypothetical protein
MAKQPKKTPLTQKKRLLDEVAGRPSLLEGAARASRLPVDGDDRVPSGSVSELQSVAAELLAAIAGASALIVSDGKHLKGDSAEWASELGSAVELLKIAGFRCDELRDLLEPEDSHA